MYYGERFNGYTHLAGAVLATAGAVTLIAQAAARADPWRTGSMVIYGVTLSLLFLASTLYHSTRGRWKEIFRKIDHCSIYLVIAGTYTPFALVSLKDTWGWTLFAAVWSLAILGVLQEVWLARGMRLTSLAIYLAMGWLGALLFFPLVEALGWNGFAWLLAGGLVYTVGIFFYLYDERFAHWHGFWHLCVLAGSTAHFTAIAMFVL